MIKAEEKVCYCPDTRANSVYIAGRCDFYVIRQSKICFSGRYSISISAVVNNGSVAGSKIVATLIYYPKSNPTKEQKKHAEIYKENFDVHDCNTIDIFDIFSDQYFKLRGLKITDYTIDRIYVRLCVTYDFKTEKLGLIYIPRRLFVSSKCEINARIDSTFDNWHGSGHIEFNVCELNSSNLTDEYDKLMNNIKHSDCIAIERLMETNSLVYSKEFIDAMSTNDESYFNSISVSENFFNLMKYFALKDWFFIPFDMKLCFHNSKLMRNMTKKYIDAYIKERGWLEYVKL